MSFRYFSFQGLFVLVALHTGLLGGVGHAAPLAYDFESLDTGNLAGQDNWLKHGFTTEATVVTGTGSNNTQVLRTSNGTGIWYRTNDSNFSFPVHSAANTVATMQADVRYANLPGSDYFFALGAGNGASTSRGPGFGIGMGGNFFLFASSAAP